jgi:hypothetical protein
VAQRRLKTKVTRHPCILSADASPCFSSHISPLPLVPTNITPERPPTDNSTPHNLFCPFQYRTVSSGVCGTRVGDRVTSIAWSGPSLLLTSVSGAVSFLLPYPPSYTPPSSSSSSAVRETACAMVRSLGFRPERTGVNGTDNRSLSMGLLCALPRHMTASGELLVSSNFLSSDSPVPHTPSASSPPVNTPHSAGSLKLIACFPDQLLLACTAVQKLKTIPLSDISSGNGSALNSVTLNARLNFSSRPCSPLEPVVLGLISMTENMLRRPHTESSEREDSVAGTPKLGGEVPYTDTYTGISTPIRQPQSATVKDLSRVSDSERHILLLRALVTTHCPPRPVAGDTAMCCAC